MTFELKNNILTISGWEIIEERFEEAQIITTGSNFLIGNGYLGYRGTLAEWDKERYVACIVTDTYDNANGRWRELCNLPNGLYTELLVDDEALSILEGETLAYQRSLDLRSGTFSRTQTWQGTEGQRVTVEAERFASFDDVHLLAMRYRVEPAKAAKITLVTGIDGDVWSLQGDHFRSLEPFREGNLIGMEMLTVEQAIRIDVVEGIKLDGPEPAAVSMQEEERHILREITFQVQAGEAITLEKVVAIYHSNDVDSPRETAIEAARAAVDRGYDLLQQRNQAAWESIWSASDIQIEGDLEAQTLARFNLYHNIIATPTHARLPIGARGLSTQVYQGAAFWDQEIFNLPMFLYTQPEVARNILAYRYDTLDGARGKAERLGYEGAYYAWTSGKTGEELFPDFFFTNVLTGRAIRNHFNDWQIHISPDIVYAMWQYYQATGDWDFIVDYGAEVIFEVARFLFSHAFVKKSKNRYEFIRLLGPDEYHENVDNNAFTNYQAQFALDKAVSIYKQLKEHNPEHLRALAERLGIDEQDVADWQDMVARLYLPQPDEETLLIEQFDGFFELEDILPGELKKRLKDPNEYWGWPNGIAVRAQVLKQADVLQLLSMHDLFSVEVIRANYDYYEPRTEHGSSLSPSVHSIVASKAGYPDEAYRFFLEAATIDLYNQSKKVVSGGSFLGGIHTAACGAVWQMIVEGFAGFHIDGDELVFDPALPERWHSYSFRLAFRSNDCTVTVRDSQIEIEAAGDNTAPLAVRVKGQSESIEAGELGLFTI